MAAHFTPDHHKGPGYGIICVEDLACESSPSFALYRASDGQCLSAHDWTTAETYLEPSAWDCDTGLLRLAVGPKVTDNLDSLDTYRIFVKEANSTKPPHTASLMIDEIVYSTMEGGQGIGENSGHEHTATAVAAPLTMTPAAMPTETVTPTEAAPLMEPIIVPEATSQEEVPTEVEEKTTAQEEPQKKKTVLWIVLVILLLLAAASAGLWWLYQNGHLPMVDDLLKNFTEEGSSINPQETPSSETPPTGTPQGDETQGDSSPSTPSSTPSAPKDIMAQTYELLRQNNTADASLALVEEVKKHPDFAGSAPDKQERAMDAIFLLTEDAAQKGHAGAMQQLGAFYDPTSTAPKGSIMPDAQQAYAWYIKAKDAGDTAASQNLQTLRAWAEKEAAAGNAAAQTLLNGWK